MSLETKYKLVPPDGGYSYIVSFATILILAPTGGFSQVLGMMYHDLMMEIGMDTTALGLLNGMNAISFAVFGFLTCPLLKVFSTRKLALIAALSFNIGGFCLPFTNSIILMFIFLSFMQYGSIAIIYNLVFTTISKYYVKKRFLAVSITQSANACATIIAPIIIKSATEYYGHRGMLLIITSISLHTLVGVTLLQPVEWHLKKEQLPESNETEMKVLLTEDKPKGLEETPTKSLDIDEPVIQENVKKDSAVKKVLRGIFDLEVLRTFVPTYGCIGISLALFADSMYVLIVPGAFYSVGFSQKYVATALSLLAFGDLLSRVLFIFSSKWLMKIGSKQVHVIGVVIAFVSRAGLLLSDNGNVMLAFMFIVGIGRCCITTTTPLVIADCVTPSKYSSALSTYMLFCGICSFIIGPILGAIRDSTNSFSIVFWLMNILFLIVIAVWFIERYIKSKETKKSTAALQG